MLKKVLNDTFERRWMKHESDKYMNENLEFYADYYLHKRINEKIHLFRDVEMYMKVEWFEKSYNLHEYFIY